MQRPARVIAVIPARGGSKTIPRKNLAPVGGVPLVARSVQAALGCAEIDRVIVSSDDAEILAVAEAYGATPLRRPAEIAADAATSESALIHAVNTLREAGESPDVMVFLQCTSPFTTAAHVAGLVAAIREGALAALTVSPNHHFLWREDADGFGHGVNHDHTKQRLRRQDLPPEYRENGAGYAMRVDAFMRAGTRFCGPTALVKTNMPAIEIDEPHDLEIVNAMLDVDGAPPMPANLRDIRALVTDFDGVHTDDLVYVGDDGREIVRCSRADGMGVEMLKAAGVDVLILSKEANAVVTRRAEKLKSPVIQGVGDKLSVLTSWAEGAGLTLKQLAYLGNDVNDLACMSAAGLALAPSDANPAARAVAHMVLPRAGGHGAVRAACDMLIAAQET